MAHWVGPGHAELCQHLLLLEQPRTPYVFINRQGTGYNSTTLGRWWRQWIVQQGGVACLASSKCRHIFVEERRSAGRVAGPADRGAAMKMGHNVETRDTYHKFKYFHPQECQAAVNDMDVWREAVTQPAATPADASTQPTAVMLWKQQPAATSAAQHKATCTSPLLALVPSTSPHSTNAKSLHARQQGGADDVEELIAPCKRHQCCAQLDD